MMVHRAGLEPARAVGSPAPQAGVYTYSTTYALDGAGGETRTLKEHVSETCAYAKFRHPGVNELVGTARLERAQAGLKCSSN